MIWHSGETEHETVWHKSSLSQADTRHAHTQHALTQYQHTYRYTYNMGTHIQYACTRTHTHTF